MGYYLFQGTYTSEAWAKLVNQPQNRVEVVRAAVEKLGGSVEGAWFSFGETDIVLICKWPDNVTAAAFAIAATAGGALKAGKTTPLLTNDELQAALKQAPKSGYRPPK